MRRALSDTGGAVYVEFLLVFLPVFILFLAVLQLGLVHAGRLVAQHAAVRAARAAVVILDDDPAFYGGERRGSIDVGGSAQTPSPLQAFMGGLGLPGASASRGGPRFRDIRDAAAIPLLAVAPSTAQLNEEDSVATAVGTGAGRAASGAQAYNAAALAVTFPTEPGASTFKTTFANDDVITVRVTYLFHCSMPLAMQLMCSSPAALGARLTGEEQSQLNLGYLAGLTNARFLVLRGESSLRNQGQ